MRQSRPCSENAIWLWGGPDNTQAREILSLHRQTAYRSCNILPVTGRRMTARYVVPGSVASHCLVSLRVFDRRVALSLAFGIFVCRGGGSHAGRGGVVRHCGGVASRVASRCRASCRVFAISRRGVERLPLGAAAAFWLAPTGFRTLLIFKKVFIYLFKLRN